MAQGLHRKCYLIIKNDAVNQSYTKIISERVQRSVMGEAETSEGVPKKPVLFSKEILIQ